MINQFIRSTSICTIILASACASGDGDDNGTDGTDTTSRAGALFFGSTDAATAANGLPFANTTSSIADLENETATVRLVRFVTDQETGDTRIEITSETFTIDDSDEGNFTATFGGETITFLDKIGERNGGIVTDLREAAEGDFAKAVSIFSSAEANMMATGENTEGFLITGFETDPDAIAALAPTGEVTYLGTLRGAGTLFEGEDLENAVIFSGVTTITADFGTGTVSGSTDLVVGLDGDLDVTLDFNGADITGNGFSTDLNVADCTAGLACTTDSQLAGVFYGPDANELGGLAAIDVTGTNDSGDTIRYVGGGAIIATPE